MDTARALRVAGPWGQGFPEPLFDGDFRVLDARIVADRHLKMRLDAGGAELESIAFGYVGGESDDSMVRGGARVRLAYRLEVNEYRGTERVQLNCQHVSPAEARVPP